MNAIRWRDGPEPPGAANLYWGEDDPIGRLAALPFSKTVLRQVVGIVGDAKQRNLIEASTPVAAPTFLRASLRSDRPACTDPDAGVQARDAIQIVIPTGGCAPCR